MVAMMGRAIRATQESIREADRLESSSDVVWIGHPFFLLWIPEPSWMLVAAHQFFRWCTSIFVRIFAIADFVIFFEGDYSAEEERCTDTCEEYNDDENNSHSAHPFVFVRR